MRAWSGSSPPPEWAFEPVNTPSIATAADAAAVDATFLKRKSAAKRGLERIASWLGRRLLGNASQRSAEVRPASILVIRHNHLGDAVVASTFIAALRERFPQAAIDVLASPYNSAVFGWVPGIRAVHVRPEGRRQRWKLYRRLRRARYGIVFQTLFNEGYFRRTLAARFIAGRGDCVGHARGTPLQAMFDHAVYLPPGPYVGKLLALLLPYSRRSVAEWLAHHPAHRLQLPPEAHADAARQLRLAGVPDQAGYVVLNLSARDPARGLGMAQAVQIAAGMTRAGCLVVAMASPEQRSRLLEIQASVPSVCIPAFGGLAAAMACVQGADLYMGPDTGSVHFAASAGTPCVVLFSNLARPDCWSPFGTRYVSIQAHAGDAVERIPAAMVCEYALRLKAGEVRAMILRPAPVPTGPFHSEETRGTSAAQTA